MYDLEKEKRKLCEEIGNFFGEFKESDGQLCIDNGEKVFRYNTPDELLIDWLDTLIENHHDMQGSGNPGDSWEKEILFIYKFSLGKHPVGLRKLDQKSGTVWQVSAYLPNPNFPHEKSVHLGVYNSIVDAIWARKTYLEDDIVGIDTNAPEGLALAISKAKERSLQAKRFKKESREVQSYAVIFTYDFDDDVAVYLFSDEEKARTFLRENFEREVEIDTEENGYDTESYIREDGWYAKIINHFDDHDDVTEYRVGIIYQ